MDVRPVRLGPTTGFDSNDYSILNVQMMLTPAMTMIGRNSYSVLNLIGDCGGLEAALAFIGSKIVGFFVSFYATAQIITMMYWKRPPT